MMVPYRGEDPDLHGSAYFGPFGSGSRVPFLGGKYGDFYIIDQIVNNLGTFLPLIKGNKQSIVSIIGNVKLFQSNK